jgi:hypothetical protein
MSFDDIFNVCRARGVRLVITGDVLRAQGRKGAVSDALKRGLAEHKQRIVEMFGDGTWLDETLPDEIFIPASVPNTLDTIRACIDGQRKRVAA